MIRLSENKSDRVPGVWVSLALWCFLFAATTTKAQLPTTIRSQHFDEAYGMMNQQIFEIQQDQNKFLWVATANGLNRFDGKSTQVFRKNYNDSNSVLDNLIIKLAIDRNNRVWIGYGSDGISCYDQVTRKFKHYLPDSAQKVSFPKGAANVMFIDSQNVLWFANGKNGLYRFEIETEKLERIGDLPYLDKTKSEKWQKHYNVISQIIEGQGDTLWMACGDGLYSYHRKNKTFEVYRFQGPGVDYERWKPDVFHTIVQMSPNDLYLGGWGTFINHFDKAKKKWTNYLIRPDQAERGTSNIVGSMQRKNDHEIWITSGDTILSVFNTLEEKFYHMSPEQVNANSFQGKGGVLFIDQTGDLWIAKFTGLFVFNQSRIYFRFTPVSVTRSDNNMNYAIVSVINDTVSQSHIISTEYADGLNIIDYSGNQFNLTYHGKQGTPEQFGGELFMDSKGRIWVLSSDNVKLYDRQTKKLVMPPQPVPDSSFKSTPFFSIAKEDRKGHLWFATFRHGVYKFNPATGIWKQWFQKSGSENSLSSNVVVDLVVDHQDNVWIFYKEHGISRINTETGKVVHYHAERGDLNSLLDDRNFCAAVDPDGKIWVGNFAGLTIIDPRSNPPIFNNQAADQEFLGTAVYDIIFDSKGVAWMINSKGITAFNPRTKLIRTFDYESGLPRLAEAHRFSKGVGDELFITSTAGYFSFSDSIASIKLKPSKIILTSFKSGDREVSFEEQLVKNKRITLNAGEDLFTVEFVSIYFRNPSAVSYRYRLRDIDRDWRSTGTRGFASYNNLPGGEYVFEIQANLGGEWSSVTAVPIFIRTPFYKTGWFNTLIAMMFAGTIFGLYRYRVRSIEKTEALKTQFNKQLAETEMKALRAQMNPHFIFNCLNSINRYIIKNDHKTASLYLTKFAKLIRLILDNSEQHEIELSQELEALKLYIEIEALRFDHKFSYEIDVDDEIDQDSIRIPAMVIQPYVENAIWHGLLHKDTQGRLVVRLKLEGEMLVCEVEDDGVGREKAMELKSKTATTRKSLGLKITAERLEALRSRFGVSGTVDFEDLKDNDGKAVGTKVIIKIPVEV